MLDNKDTISNLSFNHDGKKVVFDRCRNDGCQIQVYDLETGELAAYQSPKGERWTMGKYSYDGKQIAFSVIPIEPNGDLDLGGMQIAVMNADGKGYKKVTTGSGAKLYPILSHSGTKVLYARAAFIRKKGRTSASQYDAWEADLATDTQTQLTFFKYYYMSNLTYFPDDERFIYFGEMPTAFPSLDMTKINAKDNQEMIKQEQMKKNIGVSGVIAMKKGDTLPLENYNFDAKFFAKKPLLNKDGSKLIVEKDISGGKFFLYSPDGNHRLVGSGGSVDSAAISPDGGVLALISVSSTISINAIQNTKADQILYLPSVPKTDQSWEKARQRNEGLLKFKMLPEKPSLILNK